MTLTTADPRIEVVCRSCGETCEAFVVVDLAGLWHVKPLSMEMLVKHSTCDLLALLCGLSRVAYRNSKVTAFTVRIEE